MASPRVRPRLSRSGGLSTADLYALTFATTRLDVSRSSANSAESDASGSPVSKSASRRRAARSRPSAYDAGYASGYSPRRFVPRARPWAWVEREGVDAADSEPERSRSDRRFAGELYALRDGFGGGDGGGGSIPSRSRSAARRAIARSASARRRREAAAIASDFFVGRGIPLDAHDDPPAASAPDSDSAAGADAADRVRTDGSSVSEKNSRLSAREISPWNRVCELTWYDVRNEPGSRLGLEFEVEVETVADADAGRLSRPSPPFSVAVAGRSRAPAGPNPTRRRSSRARDATAAGRDGGGGGERRDDRESSEHRRRSSVRLGSASEP